MRKGATMIAHFDTPALVKALETAIQAARELLANQTELKKGK
jgi:hypothetical protein